MIGNTTKVLDHGFVHFEDAMGSDVRVVNAARVSFGKKKALLDANDEKLLKYLADNKHWSPFRHVQFCFHIKAPELVMRQHYKHVVGIAASSTDAANIDHAWNELSLRYVRADQLDFYVPSKFRKQSSDNKQGSSNEFLEGEAHNKALMAYVLSLETAKTEYNELFDLGVAKELARGIIPLAVYTECYWTASLQAVVNYLSLRKDAHAQWEIREYANAMEEFVKHVCPKSYEALMNV